MSFNTEKISRRIAELRRAKGITQAELGERLGVSFQAVSKWERAETLPDISLLCDLACVLETTTDSILMGGERSIEFARRVSVAQIKEGIDCIIKLGELLGRDSLFYIGAIEGIDAKMNMDTEESLKDPYTKEALIAEAIIQCMQGGAYVDVSDIKRSFEFPHWREIVTAYGEKYGIK